MSAEPVEIMEIAIVEAGGVITESISPRGFGFARFGEVLVRYGWELTDLDRAGSHAGWARADVMGVATPMDAEGWRGLVLEFWSRGGTR